MAAPKPVLIAAFALGGAILLALIALIIVLVLPHGQATPVAGSTPLPTVAASSRPNPSATATPSPTATATVPVVAAPAPADPAPAPQVQEPVVEAPAPAPAPVPLKITSMSVEFSGGCYDDQSTGFLAKWTSTGAAGSALLNLRSGGGTPIINTDYTVDPNGSQSFYLPCNRLYFYTLTIYNSDGSKWGRLTSKDGIDKGWSS